MIPSDWKYFHPDLIDKPFSAFYYQDGLLRIDFDRIVAFHIRKEISVDVLELMCYAYANRFLYGKACGESKGYGKAIDTFEKKGHF